MPLPPFERAQAAARGGNAELAIDANIELPRP